MSDLVKNNDFKQLCDGLVEDREEYYKHTKASLIVFKLRWGRKLTRSEFYGKYGAEFIPTISEETGISETILKDCCEVYEKAQLVPAKEKEFIEKYLTDYDGWNDCLRKLLGRGEKKPLDGECQHEWTCSKCGLKK